MTILFEDRPSDSPYVERVMRGWTLNDNSTPRPATYNWHMVLRKLDGKTDLLVVGPWSSAGVVTYTEGAELLWIKFQPGTFMPHLPTKNFLDKETPLPGAAGHSFWLDGSTWQFPDYENADTFVNQLTRTGVLARDPDVHAALHYQLKDVPGRTMRHRFRHTTGLTHSYIEQMKRAQQAEALLQQGVSILDTVYEAGYFDQPHLTRSLKQFLGYTPAQIVHQKKPDPLATPDHLAV